jgi:hypothetical protein
VQRYAIFTISIIKNVKREAWRHGSMGAWKLGGIEAWGHGGMEARMRGSLEFGPPAGGWNLEFWQGFQRIFF